MELYEVIVNAKHLRVNTKNFENSNFFLSMFGKVICMWDKEIQQKINPTNVKKIKNKNNKEL